MSKSKHNNNNEDTSTLARSSDGTIQITFTIPFSDIKKYMITPAIYPKIELISAEEEKDWQIRAITCELPDVDLGNYKRELSDKKKTSVIWTPGKDKKDDTNTPTREEKEQEVIKTLLENIKVNISKVLIDEEVNSRLSKLLERIEKLGLSLES